MLKYIFLLVLFASSSGNAQDDSTYLVDLKERSSEIFSKLKNENDMLTSMFERATDYQINLDFTVKDQRLLCRYLQQHVQNIKKAGIEIRYINQSYDRFKSPEIMLPFQQDLDRILSHTSAAYQYCLMPFGKEHARNSAIITGSHLLATEYALAIQEIESWPKLEFDLSLYKSDLDNIYEQLALK
tara:strand:+ start:2337 stop:2891 length:555 start_codon:yes stop_codon:yes gene_type:complete